MVRSTDPFWNDVEVMNDGSMKSKFCGHLFSQRTSISRIKWHLSGVRGRGVKICEKVPEEVQDAARAAMDGPPEKRNKYEAGSSNNEAALSPGELACWIDDITDKEIELMLGLSTPEEDDIHIKDCNKGDDNSIDEEGEENSTTYQNEALCKTLFLM
nr:uncharacterized protein LOC118056972 [Populus alba]XP_034925318.1 uncharacterized protein LOC118056972 [Populus alba]